MTNSVNNLEKVVSRRGLYCVWVSVRDGERTRLEARWIVPAADIFEPAEHREMQKVSEGDEQEEQAEVWLGTFQFA